MTFTYITFVYASCFAQKAVLGLGLGKKILMGGDKDNKETRI